MKKIKKTNKQNIKLKKTGAIAGAIAVTLSGGAFAADKAADTQNIILASEKIVAYTTCNVMEDFTASAKTKWNQIDKISSPFVSNADDSFADLKPVPDMLASVVCSCSCDCNCNCNCSCAACYCYCQCYCWCNCPCPCNCSCTCHSNW